jgi:hypothetical protein
LLTPIKHFHAVVRSEGQAVKAGAQFWIYFVTWFVLFAYYLALSFVTMVIYLLYALLAIFAYIFSLGGFKFHIAPNYDSDDISLDVKGRFFVIPIVAISVLGVLFVLTFVFALLFLTDMKDDFALIMTIVMGVVYAVTAAIFSFVVFAPRYIAKSEAVKPQDGIFLYAPQPYFETVKAEEEVCECCCDEAVAAAPVVEEAPVVAEPVVEAPVEVAVEAPAEEAVEAPIEA